MINNNSDNHNNYYSNNFMEARSVLQKIQDSVDKNEITEKCDDLIKDLSDRNLESANSIERSLLQSRAVSIIQSLSPKNPKLAGRFKEVFNSSLGLQVSLTDRPAVSAEKSESKNPKIQESKNPKIQESKNPRIQCSGRC
jgi:hypothetical protein